MSKYAVIVKPSSDATFKMSLRSFDPAANIIPDTSHSRAYLVISSIDLFDLKGLTSVESAQSLDVQKVSGVSVKDFYDYVQAKGIDASNSFAFMATPVFPPYSSQPYRTKESAFSIVVQSGILSLTLGTSYMHPTIYSQFETYFQDLYLYGPYLLREYDGNPIVSIEEDGKNVYLLTEPEKQ